MKQRGFILVASLIMLVVLTLLAVSMFGGLTSDERMSGNYREKTRAIEAAQVALDGAQSWMGVTGNVYTGSWNLGVPCAGLGALSAPTVCSDALSARQDPNGIYSYPANLPWPTGYSFLPNGMTVSTSGGIGTYTVNPTYYIQYLGQTGDNPPRGIYEVTATAQGGNANAVAVLQAVYQIQAISRDISGG